MLIVILFFALISTVIMTVWSSLKKENDLNNQRITFQSQILERSITRTLESVEASILSLETLIPQRPLDTEDPSWLARLRERIDDTLYFAPHIRQILVLKDTSVLIDSAGRSEGKHLDTQHLQLDQHRNSRSSNGLIIFGSIDQRFVPMTDQMTIRSNHSILITGLPLWFKEEKGETYWILVALNPDYFTELFDQNEGANGAHFDLSLIGYDNERLISTLPEHTPLPDVSFLLESGLKTQRIPSEHLTHALSLSLRYPVIISVTQSKQDLLYNWRSSNKNQMMMLVAFLLLILVSFTGLFIEVLRRSVIQEQKKLLFSAVEHSTAAVIVTDKYRTIVYVNSAVERLFGFSSDQLIGQNPNCLASGLTSPEVLNQLNTHLQQGLDWEGELINKTISGHPIIVATRISAVNNDQHELTHFVGIMEDITERQQHLALLHEQNIKLSQLASVFSHANEGIMICDPNGVILEVNDAFCTITGYERSDVIGQTPRLLKSGHQDSQFYAELWSAIQQDGNWNGEVWNRRKNGEVFIEHLTITAVRDENHTIVHYVSLFTDISLQKQQESRLQKMAHFDLLTNLPNRSLLLDRLKQAILNAHRHHRKLAVVFIDLDGFKRINDEYGHDAGDSLLRFVAKQMSLSLREGDTLARIGGDEFVAILTDLSDQDACKRTAKRLLQACTTTHTYKDKRFNVSASLGITFYPQEKTLDFEDLLKQADQAMYEAKLSGKNQFSIFTQVIE
ncbi:diguanylate cyclase domain-containing protein [Nitrincola nitratireducens]|uniref:diguanylate cyclase domain-containing protein n=1 Tax=Nitrincola nitratireducens TaxID=1229521 RepID=UPI0004B5064A|nr:diguanylate cyclase [Nitrincola nitratireducens]